jgi:light-harvesting complex I chlorophyll a/b binding protein 2
MRVNVCEWWPCSKVVSNVGSARTSFLAGRALRMSKAAVAAKGDMTVSATLAGDKTTPADRPLWLPGAEAPEWLDGSLPGDYGFDPLDLGEQLVTLAVVGPAIGGLVAACVG